MGIEATIVITLWIIFGYVIGRMHQYGKMKRDANQDLDVKEKERRTKWR